MTFRDLPMADRVSPDEKDMVIHARLTVGDVTIMGSDPPGGRYQRPQGYAVTIGVDTPEDAERIFATLSDGGTVGMPIAETFWARRFGMVTDRFRHAPDGELRKAHVTGAEVPPFRTAARSATRRRAANPRRLYVRDVQT